MLYIADCPVSMPTKLDGIDQPDVDMNGFGFSLTEGVFIPVYDDPDPMAPPYAEPEILMDF